MSSSGRFSFAPAHGVVDRVHDDSAGLRTLPQPPRPPGLTKAHIFMIDIADLADGRSTLHEDLADFAGGKANLRIALFLGHKLAIGARRPDQLRPLADLELQIMDQGSQGYILQWHTVSRLDIRLLATDHLIADHDLGGSDDVSLFTVHIVQQCNAR